MQILLLGSGGREHALAWKLSQSPYCQCLYIAPGNAGTAECGINVALDPNDFEAIGAFVREEAIEMVVVGPEEPLVKGIWDYFQQHEALRYIPLIGPSAQGAQLEGSKAYAKAFMEEFGIPTAAYREFSVATEMAGLDYIQQHPTPIVLKADGLAAGKGVLICNDIEEAKTEFQAMLQGKFGAAGAHVVIEQFLSGIEFSVFVLTDGHSYKILPVAKDYKRIGEGDTGLNTGGMGAVSPVPFVDEDLMEKVESRIIQPTILGLQQRGISYCGFIFLGLINVGGDPFVIEYNCRMGDPETEVVMPRLENDLVELLLAVSGGGLEDIEIEEDERAATTVILVSDGYPGPYEKGRVIAAIPETEDSLVFHAGTKKENGTLLTNGGRVLAITSLHPDFKTAVRQSNQIANTIRYEGKYYRRDIGFDL